MDESLQLAIQEEYSKLRQPGHDRFQIYYNLILIKVQFNCRDYILPLYVDVKKWIRMVYEDLETRDFGYDIPRIAVFSEVIDKLHIEKRGSLYEYLRRTADLSGYPTEEIQQLIYECRTEYYRHTKNWGALICNYLGNNNLVIAAVLLVILLSTFAIMLPAPYESLEIFQCKYVEVSGNPFVNTLSNVFIELFDINTSEPVLTPTSWRGVAVKCIGKLIILFFVTNIVCQKLTNYINRKTNA